MNAAFTTRRELHLATIGAGQIGRLPPGAPATVTGHLPSVADIRPSRDKPGRHDLSDICSVRRKIRYVAARQRPT
ncbi:hypothetical protein [Dactylosporangium sp. CA-233914]|uniref:hypothetical protein n=1 Tax=Dactylosporangium sp. CA-233914 TaxID=3239934 RepID=UPI003D933604